MWAEWYKWAPEGVIAVAALIAMAWRLLRIAFRVERALPTLLGVAEEFKENGGDSLKDNIVAMRSETEALRAALVEHSRDDENRFLRMEMIVLEGRSE